MRSSRRPARWHEPTALADAHPGRRGNRRTRRATLPHLERHKVIGLTRTRQKLELLKALGAEGVLCDVYDYEELLRVTQEARPDIVVNYLTDLSGGNAEANNRVRREGGSNLVNAATSAHALRLVLGSVSFPLDGTAADTLEQMEQTALEFPSTS